MSEGSASALDRRVKERLIGAVILTAIIVLVVPELLSGPRHEGAVSATSAAGPAVAADPGVRTVTVDLSTSKATPLADSPAAPASPPGAQPTAEPTGAADGASVAVPGPAAAEPPTIATLKAQPAAPALEKSTTGPMQRPSAADFRAVTAVPRAPLAPKPEVTPKPEVAPRQEVASRQEVSPKQEIAPRRDVDGGALAGRWAVQLGSFSNRANAEKVARQAEAHDASVSVTSIGQGASLRYRVRMGPLADRAAAEKVRARLRKAGLAASLVPP